MKLKGPTLQETLDKINNRTFHEAFHDILSSDFIEGFQRLEKINSIIRENIENILKDTLLIKSFKISNYIVDNYKISDMILKDIYTSIHDNYYHKDLHTSHFRDNIGVYERRLFEKIHYKLSSKEKLNSIFKK